MDSKILPILYRFCGQALRYPDSGWPMADLQTRFQEILTIVKADEEGQELSRFFAAEKEESILETLQIEYTRLFINSYGGVVAPLYASVYIDGILWGAFSETIRERYLRSGYSPDDTNEPPDHLATQLEFLALLHESGRPTEAEQFLAQSFRPWFSRFYQRFSAGNPHIFYRVLVELIDYLTLEEEP
jgi:TorA maturation chaperone TorD